MTDSGVNTSLAEKESEIENIEDKKFSESECTRLDEVKTNDPEISNDIMNMHVVQMVITLHSNEQIVQSLKNKFSITKCENVLRRRISHYITHFIEKHALHDFKEFCSAHGLVSHEILDPKRDNASHRRMVMTVFLRDFCKEKHSSLLCIK